MEPVYRQRRIAWLTVALLVLVAAALVSRLRATFELPVLIVGVLACLALAPFTGLSVTVTPQALEFSFLLGFMRNRVPVRNVTQVTVFRRGLNWGGHLHPSRGPAKVLPGNAIELTLSDGQVFKVAARDAERLCEAIRRARRIIGDAG